MIRFVDDRYATSSGKENIAVVKRHGQKASITDVLYVTLMTNYLISMCKLLAKGYNMKLEENQMKVYNYEGRMILKAPLANNKTFKIEIVMVDHQSLTSTIVENMNWICHHMYGYINFSMTCP